MTEPYTLILLRHGQSEWNQLNLFTGWVDVRLTEQGKNEARRGGELLAENALLAADLADLHRSRDPQQHVVELHGLEQEVGGARPHGGDSAIYGAEGRQHDHRRLRRDLLQALQWWVRQFLRRCQQCGRQRRQRGRL